MQKLRIAVDESWLPDGIPHIALLAPFWGVAGLEGASTRGLNDYAEQGGSFIEVKALKESDVAVLPFDWHFTSNDAVRETAFRAAEEADQAGRRIMVFFFSDSDEEVPLENALVLRTSLERGQRQNEFAQPAWVDDYVDVFLNGELPLRPRPKTPSVGFCGFAGYRLTPTGSLVGKARALARSAYRRLPPHTIREKAIVALRQHPGVETDFILQQNFFGGVASGDPADQLRSREVFVNNAVANDYLLCARGGGNFSYRFYEAFALGRPPLFIDTNCRLPYDFEIDYPALGVFLDAEEVEEIGGKLLERHVTLSDQDFLDIQRGCRELWEQRLSPMGFFRNLHRHLELD